MGKGPQEDHESGSGDTVEGRGDGLIHDLDVISRCSSGQPLDGIGDAPCQAKEQRRQVEGQ